MCADQEGSSTAKAVADIPLSSQVRKTNHMLDLKPSLKCFKIEPRAKEIKGRYRSDPGLFCRRRDVPDCSFSTSHAMLTFIKINNNPEPPQTSRTWKMRELNLICVFQPPPERLLGQFGKSPIDSNYVGHAGVKLHFIKICEIWEMQIPHQEEACWTEKSIFIARSNSVCLDLVYNGAIFSFWW